MFQTQVSGQWVWWQGPSCKQECQTHQSKVLWEYRDLWCARKVHSWYFIDFSQKDFIFHGCFISSNKIITQNIKMANNQKLIQVTPCKKLSSPCPFLSLLIHSSVFPYLLIAIAYLFQAERIHKILASHEESLLILIQQHSMEIKKPKRAMKDRCSI